MKPASARALAWLALVLLLVGGMIGAPEAGIAAAVLAALCSIAGLFYGTRWVRVSAGIILVLAIALAVAYFPEAGQRMGLTPSFATLAEASE